MAKEQTGSVVYVLSEVPYELYVGRAMPRYHLPESPYANPYKVGRDGDLPKVLELYELHARENIDLETLRLFLWHPSPVLACWCAPKDGTPLTLYSPEICHGQTLLRLAAEGNASLLD
ncbi:DUF4326 domain-containing protein [Rubrobacter aplysinae]|uniref:DUF4326 domain-containing protein n=1 Tax=Rubrobacter aplysinae TaxID=909625 RepID=UPI00064C1AAF|nr:DUF4326 domain-containing protein [Rubrobacter aplysinae]